MQWIRAVMAWATSDGGKLILDGKGTLHRRPALRGKYVKVMGHLTRERARLWVAVLAPGSRLTFERQADKTDPKKLYVPKEARGPRPPKTSRLGHVIAKTPELSPEAQAERDRRIEVHRRRVAAEIRRLQPHPLTSVPA